MWKEGCILLLIHFLIQYLIVRHARVLIGKETDRARKHAHVFLKNQMIASVDISGKVIEGELNREGKMFVKNFCVDIINEILRWWNYE